MADDRYSIPWAPPDIGPGVNMIMSAINANRADERSRAYLDMEQAAVKDRAERESAALARQKEQDQYNRDVAAFTAMPALQRAAMKSVGMANMNPYGVKFDEGQSQAPSLRESGINVMGGNEQYAEHAKQALADELPTEVAPVDTTVGQHSGAPTIPMGQHSGTPQLEEIGEPSPHDETAEAEAVSPPIAAAQALIGQPRQRQVFATYKGQRFEVPPQSEHSPFGPEYDDMYRTLIDEGIPIDKATAIVAARAKADMAEGGRNTRAANTIEARNLNREDQQVFIEMQNKLYKNEPITIADRDRWEAMRARARVSAAAAEKPSVADSSEATAMKTFLADLKDYRDRVAQAGPEVKATRNINEIQRLAQSTNPVDQALAVEQIGKIAHGGNTVTKATQDLIYHHMGGTPERFEANLNQILDHGRLAPAQLRMLQETTAALAQHHDENKNTIKAGAEVQFGPTSIYGSPYMQPMVRQHLDALYKEMGIEGDQAATAANPTTEGSIRLGRNRGRKTGAPGADPIRAKAERALKDPNAPPEAKEAARKILGR